MTLDAYVARRFRERGVRLFHAENLRNFRTYCGARGLLSREGLMHEDPSGFTAFYSDEEDRELGVLGRVFGNLSDFGQVFVRGGKTIPNVYGPITLMFRPDVFSRMSDIRITQRSVASLHHMWERSALSTTQEIDGLLYGDTYGEPIHSSWYSCELSCSNPVVPFDHLEGVLVEPIQVHGRRLRAVVEETLGAHGITATVKERTYFNPAKRQALQKLVTLCEALRPPTAQWKWSMDASRLPREFRELRSDLQKRVIVWCRYFTYGTVLPLRAKDHERDDDLMSIALF